MGYYYYHFYLLIIYLLITIIIVVVIIIIILVYIILSWPVLLLPWLISLKSKLNDHCICAIQINLNLNWAIYILPYFKYIYELSKSKNINATLQMKTFIDFTSAASLSVYPSMVGYHSAETCKVNTLPVQILYLKCKWACHNILKKKLICRSTGKTCSLSLYLLYPHNNTEHKQTNENRVTGHSVTGNRWKRKQSPELWMESIVARVWLFQCEIKPGK